MNSERILLFICIVLLSNCSVRMIPLAERQDIQIYYSSTEFVNKTPSEGKWYTKVKKTEKDYIQCDNIFNGLDNTVLKEPNLPWAIKMDGIDYVHMRYCDEYRSVNIYSKYDIEGKICALFISGDTSGKIKSGGAQAHHYGGGLLGYWLAAGTKSGNNWRNADGKKIKILTINTTRINPRTNKPWKKHLSKMLSKKNFNAELNSNFTKEEIDDFTFEEVVEIIKKVNASE